MSRGKSENLAQCLKTLLNLCLLISPTELEYSFLPPKNYTKINLLRSAEGFADTNCVIREKQIYFQWNRTLISKEPFWRSVTKMKKHPILTRGAMWPLHISHCFNKAKSFSLYFNLHWSLQGLRAREALTAPKPTKVTPVWLPGIKQMVLENLRKLWTFSHHHHDTTRSLSDSSYLKNKINIK